MTQAATGTLHSGLCEVDDMPPIAAEMQNSRDVNVLTCHRSKSGLTEVNGIVNIDRNGCVAAQRTQSWMECRKKSQLHTHLPGHQWKQGVLSTFQDMAAAAVLLQ